MTKSSLITIIGTIVVAVLIAFFLASVVSPRPSVPSTCPQTSGPVVVTSVSISLNVAPSVVELITQSPSTCSYASAPGVVTTLSVQLQSVVNLTFTATVTALSGATAAAGFSLGAVQAITLQPFADNTLKVPIMAPSQAYDGPIAFTVNLQEEP